MVEFTTVSTVDLVQCVASDDMVIKAARVSTNTDHNIEDGDYRLIDYLMRSRHTSPFEHGSFTFCIETPIFVAREAMRHRSLSFNELSGRYSSLEPFFYLIGEDRPTKQIGKVGEYQFVKDDELNRTARMEQIRIAKMCYNSYYKQLDAGVAKEVARMVLPVNIFTRFYLTGNPLNILRFLSLRTEDDAADIKSHPQYEIEYVAREMEKVFADKMPVTYAAWCKHGRK